MKKTISIETLGKIRLGLAYLLLILGSIGLIDTIANGLSACYLFAVILAFIIGGVTIWGPEEK